jgi:hypothetical protein
MDRAIGVVSAAADDWTVGKWPRDSALTRAADIADATWAADIPDTAGATNVANAARTANVAEAGAIRHGALNSAAAEARAPNVSNARSIESTAALPGSIESAEVPESPATGASCRSKVVWQLERRALLGNSTAAATRAINRVAGSASGGMEVAE